MRAAIRAAAGSGLAAAVLVLAGCTPVPGGPAHWGSGGTDVDVLCSSVAVRKPMIVADVVSAPETGSIELVSIEPIGPAHLRIDGIFVSLLEEESGAVGNSPLPPTDELSEQVWDAREPVEGFELEAGARANVLVVAERTDSDQGRLANINIRYRSGGVLYEKSATTQYLFAELCPGG